MKIVRSVLAVLAGYVVKGLVASVFLLFAGWHTTDTPSQQVVLILMFWRVVASLAAGYVTGAVARRAEIEHAAGLATLAVVVALGSMLAGTGGKEPLWAQIAHLLLMPPLILLGGYLRKRQREFTGDPPVGSA